MNPLYHSLAPSAPPESIDQNPFRSDSAKSYEVVKTESNFNNEFIIQLTKFIGEFHEKFTFQPYVNTENHIHNIHQWIQYFVGYGLEPYRLLPSVERTQKCDQFINQLLTALIIIKSSRINLPEEQWFALISKEPFFECLEIALRNCFFNNLIQIENQCVNCYFDLHKKFPDDLGEREEALETLATKNHFFHLPDYEFYNRISHFYPKNEIDGCATKAEKFPLSSAISSCNQLVEHQLSQFHLKKHSYISLQFEFYLRSRLGSVIFSKYQQHFKEAFDATGNIDPALFNATCNHIFTFYSSGNKFQSSNAIEAMVASVFEIESKSFPAWRSEIEAKKIAAENKQSQRYGLTNFLDRTTAHVIALATAQLATLSWAEMLYSAQQSPPILQPQQIGQESCAKTSESDSSSSSEDFAIVPEPAAKALRPMQPLPSSLPPPQNIAPALPPVIHTAPVRVYKATDTDIPLVSYIDIAYRSLLESGQGDNAIWNALPIAVRIDALLHISCLYGFNGKAEQIAYNFFSTVFSAETEIASLKRTLSNTGSKTGLARQGEAVLDLYYSPNKNWNILNEKFHQLPVDGIFYKYVYEMAEAAGVGIESWDRQFAQYNWKHSEMMHLSMQALERRLHTYSGS